MSTPTSTDIPLLPRVPRKLADDLDSRGDGHRICEHVLDRRGVLDVGAQLLQLLLARSGRLDDRLRTDLLEARSDLAADPEEVPEIDVALDLVGHLLDLDPAGCGVRDVADGVAEAERG